ncbi:MAG: twin-arginine translocase TatA/TatE family subunit [Deltaproteobacteria bacterium]|nr:twin-arginine translocase TatA/TatE family subunit [Deltaproteobacteria bacterium]
MGCHHNEILIVIVVVMLVMGVNRLPQIGDSLGRAIRNFKRGVQGENEIDVTPSKKRVESGRSTTSASSGLSGASGSPAASGPSSGLDRSGDDSDAPDRQR